MLDAESGRSGAAGWRFQGHMSPAAILNWTKAGNLPWHRYFEGVAVALDCHIAEPDEPQALAALDRMLSQAFANHSGRVGVIATGRGHCTGHCLHMIRSEGLSHVATAHAFDSGGRHTSTGWEGGAWYNRFDCVQTWARHVVACHGTTLDMLCLASDVMGGGQDGGCRRRSPTFNLRHAGGQRRTTSSYDKTPQLGLQLQCR